MFDIRTPDRKVLIETLTFLPQHSSGIPHFQQSEGNQIHPSLLSKNKAGNHNTLPRDSDLGVASTLSVSGANVAHIQRDRLLCLWRFSVLFNFSKMILNPGPFPETLI